jgi:hypothetical protein
MPKLHFLNTLYYGNAKTDFFDKDTFKNHCAQNYFNIYASQVNLTFLDNSFCLPS